MSPLIAGLLVLGISSAGSSAAGTSTQSQEPCLRVCEQETTNAGRRECLRRERAVAERELNTVVAAVECSFLDRKKTLDPTIAETFKRAQSAWVTYYTADCSAVGATWTDGSGRGGAVEFCLLEQTRRRIVDIGFTYHPKQLSGPPVLVCTSLRPDA